MPPRDEFLAEMEDILELPLRSLTGSEVLDGYEAWDSLGVLSFVMYAERVGRKVSAASVRSARSVDDLFALVSVVASNA